MKCRLASGGTVPDAKKGLCSLRPVFGHPSTWLLRSSVKALTCWSFLLSVLPFQSIQEPKVAMRLSLCLWPLQVAGFPTLTHTPPFHYHVSFKDEALTHSTSRMT